MNTRWKFNGGLRLDGRKALSTEQPLKEAKIPSQLVYPLQQRAGVIAEPCVEPGERVLMGQVIARSDSLMSVPVHASSSGIVRGVEERVVAHPSGWSSRCLVIDTDGKDEPCRFEGFADYRKLDRGFIRERIREAGIVGLGGASFPTSVKLNTRDDHRIDTLILNGAECEPYITCDDTLLRSRAYDVLESANILLHTLGVNRCLLCVEDDAPATIRKLREVAEAPGFEKIEIVEVPTRYPTGGERQLIRVVTGREVPSGGLPADVGVVCTNVGTAAAVYHAICFGEPLISRVVTVTGLGVSNPRNLVVRIGTPISELVAQCGGYTDRARRLIMGGAMMGLALPSDDIPVVKGTNCILVADESEIRGEQPVSPCIRCGECAKACPVNLLPQQLYWHSRAGELDKAEDLKLFDCIECGCCEVVCPSHIPLVQYYRSAKSEVASRARDREQADHARQRFEARQARLEREKREKEERSRQKKEALARKKAAEAGAKQVQAGGEQVQPETAAGNTALDQKPAETSPANEEG